MATPRSRMNGVEKRPHRSLATPRAKLLKVGTAMIATTTLALAATMRGDHGPPEAHVLHLVLSAVPVACAVGYLLAGALLLPRK